MRITRLAYLATHPIQYQAPLLKRIAAEPDIALTAFFESDVSTRGYFDHGFGRTIEWDVRLLDGYRSEFLPALPGGAATGIPGFWRPLTTGLIRRLLRGRFDALWVHGYARAHHLAMLTGARALGLRTLLRDEMWQDARARDATRAASKARLWPAVDLSVSAYLAIGAHNADYYRQLGVPAAKIFAMPYAVDNAWFRRRIAAAAAGREALRASLGIAPDRLVFLQPAKLLPHKRPVASVEAFVQLKRDGLEERAVLLLAGDGPERAAVEGLVAQHGLGNVRVLGFQNQAEMAGLYGLADVCLLPSQWEPWGLAINEAMNGGCAIVASDRVGSAPDLIREANGIVVPQGDQAALTAAIRQLVAAPDQTRRMGQASLAIVDGWGFEQDVAGLRQALRLPLVPNG